MKYERGEKPTSYKLKVLILIFLISSILFAQFQKELPEAFAKRTKWWREAKFGMFIHWGIYAVPADSTDLEGRKIVGEWFMHNKKMQVSEYEKFAKQFNPVKFNAREWVRMAKEAGMKYIVITSKHHDGFCMFDSDLTDYNIVKGTPFGRDPLKELAKECKHQGIRLGFYYSILDWHHPDYLPRRPWEKDVRPEKGADLNLYIDYMKGQLKELLTKYDQVAVLWFDGWWEHNAEELRSSEVNSFVRSLQPDILINDRNHLPEDFSTPEQTIPARAMPGGRLWETCMTINDTWGYAKNDKNWKPAKDLIRKLCDIAHKGGNFLLNVGPTAEGTFPEPVVERLKKIGEWMKVNGESIYGTTQCPFRKLSFDGRCTVKGNILYLHVFQWPERDLKLEGLETKVLSARTLSDIKKLKFRVEHVEKEGGMKVLYISKPKNLDPAVTVVKLTLAGKPVVKEVLEVIKPDENEKIICHARDAELHGSYIRYEYGDGKDNIGFWTNASDYATWNIFVPEKGRYKIIFTYACPPENAGSKVKIEIEEGEGAETIIEATPSWKDFNDYFIGELILPHGTHVFSVRVIEMPKGAVMNLQKVVLEPVK